MKEKYVIGDSAQPSSEEKKTGWPAPPLAQDDDRDLSKALAETACLTCMKQAAKPAPETWFSKWRAVIESAA